VGQGSVVDRPRAPLGVREIGLIGGLAVVACSRGTRRSDHPEDHRASQEHVGGADVSDVQAKQLGDSWPDHHHARRDARAHVGRRPELALRGRHLSGLRKLGDHQSGRCRRRANAARPGPRSALTTAAPILHVWPGLLRRDATGDGNFIRAKGPGGVRPLFARTSSHRARTVPKAPSMDPMGWKAARGGALRICIFDR
jgi:hypothetical protein